MLEQGIPITEVVCGFLIANIFNNQLICTCTRDQGERGEGEERRGGSLYPAACVWLCGENNLENDKGYKPENGNGGGGEQWAN